MTPKVFAKKLHNLFVEAGLPSKREHNIVEITDFSGSAVFELKPKAYMGADMVIIKTTDDEVRFLAK